MKCAGGFVVRSKWMRLTIHWCCLSADWALIALSGVDYGFISVLFRGVI